MSWWLAITVTAGGFVGSVLLVVLVFEGLRHLMLRIGRTWHSIDYPGSAVPPFGLSLVASLLTDKQGNCCFGAYLVDYDRKMHTARGLWIIKPKVDDVRPKLEVPK